MKNLYVIFMICVIIDEGYGVKDCGPLEADQYCNYACEKDSPVIIKCSWYGTDIQLHSGSYGFWDCKGKNCNPCELPSDDPGQYLCEEMEDTEFLHAKNQCDGEQDCFVDVNPFALKNTFNCCPHNDDNKCQLGDRSLVTALKWSCPQVDPTMQVAVGCFSSIEKLVLQCWGQYVIDVIHSEYGLSTTNPCQDGSWKPDDCMVPGDEARLQEIKGKCQHVQRCQLMAELKDFACNGSPTNYERVYYNCVTAPSSTFPTTTGISLTTSEPSGEMHTSSKSTSDAVTSEPDTTDIPDELSTISFTLSPTDDDAGTTEETLPPKAGSTMIIVGSVMAVLVVLAVAITAVVCYRKRKKPPTTNTSKNDISPTDPQELQIQPSTLDDNDTIPDDEPAKYYEIQDVKIQMSKQRPNADEHNYYNASALLTPSMGNSQPPMLKIRKLKQRPNSYEHAYYNASALLTLSIDNPQPAMPTKPSGAEAIEFEMRDIKMDIHGTSLPEDPNLIQQPNTLEPSDGNPAFLYDDGSSLKTAVAQGNDSSYENVLWGMASGNEDQGESLESGNTTDFEGVDVNNTGKEDLVMAEIVAWGRGTGGAPIGAGNGTYENIGESEETRMDGNGAYEDLGERQETRVDGNGAYEDLREREETHTAGNNAYEDLREREETLVDRNVVYEDLGEREETHVDGNGAYEDLR